MNIIVHGWLSSVLFRVLQRKLFLISLFLICSVEVKVTVMVEAVVKVMVNVITTVSPFHELSICDCSV